MDPASTFKMSADQRFLLDRFSLSFLAILISGLLIGCGLLFQTYHVSLSNSTWETMRQIGLPFIISEIFIILLALRNGLQFQNIWNNLPLLIRVISTLFLLTFSIGTMISSEIPVISFVQNIIYIVHICFAVSIYHIVGTVNSDEVRKMAGWIAAGLAVFCAMTAIAFVNPPPISLLKAEIVWQFAIPGFISVRLFGAFCGAIFCFLLVQLLIDDERQKDMFWPYLWITLASGMAIWSGTRAAVVGSTCAVFFVVFVYQIRPTLKTVIGIVAAIAVATSLAALLIPYDDSAFKMIAEGDAADANAISGGRFDYWSAVWKAYTNVPLFGAGPFASFWILPPGEQIHVQPHNLILQFLLTWGVFATVFALLLLGYTTWQAHKVAFKQRSILPFLAMLDCLLVMSMFDGILHFAQHMMLIMTSYGVIFGASRTCVR